MKTKIVFQDRLSLNAGQKYCRMLQGEHFAILSTFIKLPFVIKIFSGHIRQLYCIANKRSSVHLLDCTGDGLPVPLLFACDRIRG